MESVSVHESDRAADGNSEGVPIDMGDGKTVTCSRLPAGLGDSVTSIDQLRHNKKNDATLGIWRVNATHGSAVLKISTPPPHGAPAGFWPTSDEPTHWNYWRRESLAYTTDLAVTAYAEAGIVAPGLLAAVDRPDGLVELWLEDVEGPEGFDWEVSRLVRFAHELGVGQARWAGRVPDHPWLSRRWLTQYLTEGPPLSVDIEDTFWDHSRVAAWPADVRRGLRRLWVERDRMLAAAEASERTLCHLDVWPANLIDGQGRSVLLDWSFTGAGAIGEDVSNLVIDSFTDGLMDPSLLPDVTEGVTEAYLDGLHDGGWTGSKDGVRKAIKLCGAAKYSWLGPAVLGRVVREDLGTSSYNRDSSPDEAARRVLGLVTLISDWAGEATD